MIGRIPILDVQPVVECGRRSAKAVAGETFQVSATVLIEGHGALGAGVVLRDPAGKVGPLIRMRGLEPGTDRYGADVTVTSEGTWHFHVESWSDPIAHWDHDASIKIPRGQDVELMLAEGALLFERAARAIKQPPGAARPAAARADLNALGRRLRDRSLPPWDRLAATRAPRIAAILGEYPSGTWSPGPGGCRCSSSGSAPLRVLVRILPAFRRCPVRPDGPQGADLRDAADRGTAGLRRSPRWASTSSTCRRSTRSARASAKGATTRLRHAPATRARRGRSARRKAGTTPSTRTSARSPTSTCSSPGPGSSAWR